MGIYRLYPVRLKSVVLARNLGDGRRIWCEFAVGQSYIRSSGTRDKRLAEQMGLVLRRHFHTLGYFSNEEQTKHSKHPDQFILNSRHLI
jgi:hypothetical protein